MLLTIVALPDIPLIQPGDDLIRVIFDGMTRAGLSLQSGDVLVISSKIVSKAEGCIVDLKTIDPGSEATRLAEETQKDPRVVELILRESRGISRAVPGVLVSEHRLGFISANAGIDQSNVDESGDHVLLLPTDPDASAQEIRAGIRKSVGVDVAIVISDTHGRPFRMGNVGVAIGVSGMPALVDLRGQIDLFGRELQISMQGYGDLVASAAHLVCGEGDEGRPVVFMRGLQFPPTDGQARDLIRPAEQDLYR